MRNSGSIENAQSYGPRFRVMVEALREELCAGDVPVIAGALGGYLCERAGLHFDSPSLRTLGVRYADAYLNVLRG